LGKVILNDIHIEIARKPFLRLLFLDKSKHIQVSQIFSKQSNTGKEWGISKHQLSMRKKRHGRRAESEQSMEVPQAQSFQCLQYRISHSSVQSRANKGYKKQAHSLTKETVVTETVARLDKEKWYRPKIITQSSPHISSIVSDKRQQENVITKFCVTNPRGPSWKLGRSESRFQYVKKADTKMPSGQV
jgi:hypothetical protein